MRKRFLLILCLLFETSLQAEQKKPLAAPLCLASPSKMFVGAYGGYGVLSGAYKNDGVSAFGRLAFGVDAGIWKRCGFGFEVAFQSGNTIRLETSDTLIAAAGGLPIQASLKPFIDFLASGKCRLIDSYPLYIFLKGGFAFRQLQLEERTSSRDQLNRVNGEIQAGFNYQLTSHGRISVSYQAIISSGSSGIKLSSSNDILLNHIPTQQGALFGVEYSL
jgi:hypothetical protein